MKDSQSHTVFVQSERIGYIPAKCEYWRKWYIWSFFHILSWEKIINSGFRKNNICFLAHSWMQRILQLVVSLVYSILVVWSQDELLVTSIFSPFNIVVETSLACNRFTSFISIAVSLFTLVVNTKGITVDLPCGMKVISWNIKLISMHAGKKV